MTELLHALRDRRQRVSFEVQSDPDPDVTAGATLRPAEDIERRVRKR